MDGSDKMSMVSTKIEKWKYKLLDLGKRNRLLNYRERKRINIVIARPDMDRVFSLLVHDGYTLEFICKDSKINPANYDAVDEQENPPAIDINDIELDKGDILTNRSDSEMLKTLAQIRARAKTAMEEQGVNILYVAFGFLEWSESENSSVFLKSPIVLVPVHLVLESILDSYKLSMTDDDIVINPTLRFKLQRDFNINLPELVDDDQSILEYLNHIQDIVAPKRWKVFQEVHLSLLSFLKLNMYEDLENHQDKAAGHFLVKALAGDRSELKQVPEELIQGYDHDAKIRPIDTFQVVDADSSQQDAIVAAKNGISFVLQGPPGTGKSQTITNIIAECLADGKKVLFVSEKVAALEVVYKRLKEVGLTDFCLPLHSHKTSKKDVLHELGRTLNMSRYYTRDEAIADLEQLLEDRNRLNEYEKSLHNPCPPLGKTIYEMHGKLLKYQSAPDVQFAIDNVENVVQSDINRYQRLLEQFALTAGKLGDDYAQNPWYGCNVKAFNLELQHDILTNFKALISYLQGLNDICTELMLNLPLSEYKTIFQVEQLKIILQVAADSTKPPVMWITEEEIGPLTEKAKAYLDMSLAYNATRNELLAAYNNDVLAIEAEPIHRQLLEDISLLLGYLKEESVQSQEDILLKREWLAKSLNSVQALCEGLQKYSLELFQALGMNQPITINGAASIIELAANILAHPNPTAMWFDKRLYAVVQKNFADAKNTYDKMNAVETEIFSTFNKEVINSDYSAILARFNTEYNSMFKFFKPNYHKDKKSILAFKKEPTLKLKDQDIIKYLKLLKDLVDAKSWTSEHRVQLCDNLGTWFNDEYTDWNAVAKAFKTFEAIQEFFGYEEMPEKIMGILLNPRSTTQLIKNPHDQLRVLLAQEATIELAESLVRTDVMLRNTSLEKLITSIEIVYAALYRTFGSYDRIKACYRRPNPLSMDTLLRDLEMMEMLHESERLIDTESMELKQLYDYYFNGIDTDWEEILNSLSWASEFKDSVRVFDLSSQFVELICTNEEAIRQAHDGTAKLDQYLARIEPQILYLTSLFGDLYDFKQLNIDAMDHWLQACIDNFLGLEEWLDFARSREACYDAGLGSFIDAAMAAKLANNSIVGAFFKRFYRLWLDVMYLRFPAVSGFRRRNHEVTVGNFRELDSKQLIIARARIKELLSSKLPSNSFISSGRGEIDILKRELNKRKKIMPLRKLFGKIPNLLLGLKPCLMMSPLSVSFFLDPEYYEFDVVIFDEASQICPEDAIGTIFRAKQVIIAGDSEQLPPTNFFAASSGETEFEENNEDDEDDIEAYESILDEAAAILPEKTLRWHYRSKHEHLIAFSNVKIYAKKHETLITFPSTRERVADYGVEYVYVSNGIYDRSASRSNKEEAARIAELVSDHFKKHPQRSLGVVTFSEAQQNEVEAAIRQLRMKNPRLERFFDETKEEAFFIKNLENVQGDERDTIIFSIGYAKDHNGVMHMNFGPLSRVGGYRRLNVAITRAKYNVKLVGSIRPTDIDLDRTGSDGVKMLRSYIEFALHGPDALQSEIIEPESIYTESPFEEEVYKFLVSKGYKVITQVGCSGYRIDMAVKHPTISGRYVIGVECDGATYHSARTARERDRLREDVLCRRGWQLYRIWSTDWMKDPENEGKRLIDAVERALVNWDNDEETSGWKEQDSEEQVNDGPDDFAEAISEVAVEKEEPDSGYGFVKYQIADVDSIKRLQGEGEPKYLARTIKHVIEVEGPIHFDLMCKRLAHLFGREKVTSPVRNSIEYILNGNIKQEVESKDGFYQIKNSDVIYVRMPASPDDIRKIEHVSKDELAHAMTAIVMHRYGISATDLFIETARIFGFNRTGGKIKEAMSIALDYLIREEKVTERDGKVGWGAR